MRGGCPLQAPSLPGGVAADTRDDPGLESGQGRRDRPDPRHLLRRSPRKQGIPLRHRSRPAPGAIRIVCTRFVADCGTDGDTTGGKDRWGTGAGWAMDLVTGSIHCGGAGAARTSEPEWPGSVYVTSLRTHTSCRLQVVISSTQATSRRAPANNSRSSTDDRHISAAPHRSQPHPAPRSTPTTPTGRGGWPYRCRPSIRHCPGCHGVSNPTSHGLNGSTPPNAVSDLAVSRSGESAT